MNLGAKLRFYLYIKELLCSFFAKKSKIMIFFEKYRAYFEKNAYFCGLK